MSDTELMVLLFQGSQTEFGESGTILQSCIKENSIIKPAQNGHSKIGKTKIVMTNGSLMKVVIIAECNFLFFLRMAILHRFYCTIFTSNIWTDRPG